MALVDRLTALPRRLLQRLDALGNPQRREHEQQLEAQLNAVLGGLRRDVGIGPRTDAPQPPRSDAALQRELDVRNRMARKHGRVDSFGNFRTGIGVRGVDKRIGFGSWGYQDIPEIESRFILRGSDMAQRLVGKVVDEMFREGFHCRIADDKDASVAMDRANREMGLQNSLIEAFKVKRAYGGCGLFLGADDGTKDLSLPLREDRIRTFDFVQPFSPLEMVPVTWYADPLRPKFGTPETYRLTPLDRPPGWSPDQFSLPIVHESRVLAFQGIVNWRGQIVYNVHPGWGDSIFVAAKQVLEDFEQAFGGASILMADFAVATLKLKGLAELLSAGGAELQTRAQALEDGRSTARVTIVDSEEDFKRESTTVTGLPDLLDRMMSRLSACGDIPVSLLMGEAPAGLNATGDSDIRWWYGSVAAKQRNEALPPLERIMRLRFLAKNSVTKGKLPAKWSIHFPTLWRPSELELSTIRKNQSDADIAYINALVLTPEEVAQSRFGGEEYSTDTHLDSDLRAQMSTPDEETSAPPEPPSPDGAPPQGSATPLPKAAGGNEGFPDLNRAITTSTRPGGKGKETAPPPGPQAASNVPDDPGNGRRRGKR